MKQIIVYLIISLMLTTVYILGCSNDDKAKSPNSKKEAVSTLEKGDEVVSEKGAVEKLTHEVAKEAVSRIKTPIEKAQAVKDKQDGDYNDMKKTLSN